MKTKKSNLFIFGIIPALLLFQSLIAHSNPVHAQGEVTPSETGLPTVVPTATTDVPTATVVAPPSLTSLSPSEAFFEQGDLPLTLDGSGFLPESIVFWNGTNALQTTFVSETQLTATFPSSAFNHSAVLKISVKNPDSSFSTELDFTVKNPTPELTGIFPDYATAGDGGFTIVLSGNNFVTESKVFWNNAQLSTSFISEVIETFTKK